jgi:hypothetical protein
MFRPWRLSSGCYLIQHLKIYKTALVSVVNDSNWCSSNCGTAVTIHCEFITCYNFSALFAKLRKATISFVVSFRPSAWNSSALWSDFLEIWYLNMFRKSVEKIQASLKTDSITGTLHEDQCTFCILSRSFLLRMTDVSEKSCRENQNTHFMFNNF